MALLAAVPVEGDGEAVGLVANGLDELERRRRPGQPNAVAPDRRVEDLLALGDGYEGELRQAERRQGLLGRAELGLAAVDHDQVGQGRALAEELAVAPGQDLAQAGDVVRALDRADEELAVSVLVGAAVAEDDERPDRFLAAGVGDVEALDRPRQGRQSEGRFQLLEGDEGAGLAAEIGLGVAPGHVDELPVAAAAGREGADLGPAEQGLQARRRGRLDRQQQARRQVAVAVEPGQEAAQEVVVGEAGGDVQHPGFRVPDLAAPHEEDVDRGPVGQAGQADDVLVLEGRGDGPGPILVVLDRPQQVAPAGRFLELLAFGLDLHPRPERPGQLGQAPFEEEAGVVDALAVFGLGHQADAGRRAQPELVFEAGPLAAAEDGLLAAPDPEVLVDQVDGGAGSSGRAERTEVARAVGLDLAAEVDPGPGLADRELDVGEALVVLEAEVEAGLVLLDVVVLEEGRFLLGARQDVVDVGRLAEDAADLEVGFGQEVGADPVAQGAGLADVDDLARGALEEVDAGLGRQFGGPFLQLPARRGRRRPSRTRGRPRPPS
ncbi:MAG: hypothetical protein MUE80_04290 [Acidobacteria bacterium]|nr:hypothetical protein [Acidobacteriota bacterium]